MGISIAFNQEATGVRAMQGAPPRPWPRNTGIRTRLEEKQTADAQAFLYPAGVMGKIVKYGSRETVFTQGDPATSVVYIQKGSVKLAVVNEVGKEAVMAILGPRDFFGEGCLAGQPQRVSTAVAITPTTALVFEKSEMIQLLHAKQAFSDQFIMHVLSSKFRIEENLVDQLFYSVEKRLARTLMMLARVNNEEEPEKMGPGISQEMLADMIGTTRSRVNCFMNKFRKLGYIKYRGSLGGLQVNKSLLSTVLQD
jgi:CRP/FNR family cyclic AMP-dependent transcriptional regulator